MISKPLWNQSLAAMGIKTCITTLSVPGRRLWISVYITFDKDIISLSKFQILQTKCIAALADKYQDFYFELLPDIQLDSMDEEKIKAQTEENT